MATTYICPNCGNKVILERPVDNITCPYCNMFFNTANNQQPPQFGGNQQQYGQQQPYGQPQYGYQQPYRNNDVFAEGPSGKSRGVAGLLAILVGAIGIHYFYLGKTTPGIVFLVASLISCGILAAATGIISLIQGIMMFTMSQQEFEDKYTNPAVSFPLF